MRATVGRSGDVIEVDILMLGLDACVHQGKSRWIFDGISSLRRQSSGPKVSSENGSCVMLRRHASVRLLKAWVRRMKATASLNLGLRFIIKPGKSSCDFNKD